MSLPAAEVEALRIQCRSAREAGEFEAAIKAGQELWQSSPDRNGWDAWNLAFSLRKSERPRDAYRVAWEGLELVQHDAAAVDAVGERLASEYGWSVYNAELRNPKDPSPARVANAATSVVRVWDRYAPSKPWTTQYCPVPLVVNRAMKLLKEARAWTHLADLASATDGDRMPDDPMRPDQADDPRGSWTRAEAWYVSAAKAFVEEDRNEAALAIVDRGIRRSPELGQHCLKWLYFHGAKAAISEGDGSRGLEMVSLARGAGVTEWWMGVVEARAAHLAGDRRVALAALAEAFVGADQRHVPPEFLCTALDTSTALLATEHPDLAKQCAQVNRGIREGRGWRIPDSLEVASGGESAAEMELAKIIAGWRVFQRTLQPRSSGTITRLLNEGSGFLADDHGPDRYFSFPRGSTMPDWCREGARITFRPTQRLDRKSGVEKPAAEDLELAAP